MKIASWNVNGINAIRQKGLLSAIKEIDADVFCFQEVKTMCQILTPGYYQYWNTASRKGYSGTMTLTKTHPLSVSYGFGSKYPDNDGRIISLEFPAVFIINVYVPNSQASKDRLDFRMEWESALTAYLESLPKPAILCGDFNVARDYIDVYPENLRNEQCPPGFLTQEREGMERILSAGYTDAFRKLFPRRKGCYTWWSNRLNKRLENRGWRLDYFLVADILSDGIQSVTHEVKIMGSDHCPITLCITLPKKKDSRPLDALAQQWREIDWQKCEETLLLLQQKISKAAYLKNWNRVERLQKKLTFSIEAKSLAVRHVSATGSAAGIDGVKWAADAERMQAVLSLTSKDYKAQPYRCIILHEKEKEKDRRIQVPTAHDKAMQVLYAYSLAPVSEAAADRKSFAFRQGRSPLDVHYYICKMFSGINAPEWIVRADIHAHFDAISHKWLLQNIPMCYKVMREFLGAGSMFGGSLFPTTEGISQGSGLSTVLGNMVLDGLQKYIHDRLCGHETNFCYSTEYKSAYPPGFDYRNGDMIRFADDILFSARTKEDAKKILGYTAEFLSVRGLELNHDKTYITTVHDGFEFLSRRYQFEDGSLQSYPSDKAILRCEKKLEKAILNFDGSQKSLIEKVNRILSGWAAYHRISSGCLIAFRQIDALVQTLLVKKVRLMHPKRQWGHLQNKYWYKKSSGYHVFALEDNPSIRILQLAGLPPVKHRAVNTSFNPYLDNDYYTSLVERRNIQKRSTPEYRAIWNRQRGCCHYCGHPMNPDQDVTLTELNIGCGRNIQNLAYVHSRCADMQLDELYDELLDNPAAESFADIEQPDVLNLLDGVTQICPDTNEPYENLREYFRKKEKSPLSLTFGQIEKIMEDKLDDTAYTDENFWCDTDFKADKGETNKYKCISETWTSQGYDILRLHMDEQRIVLKKILHNVSGLKLPAKLTERKLPNEAVYEANEFFRYLIKKYGL